MTSVLAVDDSVSMRQMIAHTLRSAGCHVLEACDGKDALEKLAAAPVDVVLTDRHMPRMDGLELTRVLRAEPRYRHLPVLVLTTDDDTAARDEARAAGATGWLTKPFDPRRLIETLLHVAQAQEHRHGA